MLLPLHLSGQHTLRSIKWIALPNVQLRWSHIVVSCPCYQSHLAGWNCPQTMPFRSVQMQGSWLPGFLNSWWRHIHWELICTGYLVSLLYLAIMTIVDGKYKNAILKKQSTTQQQHTSRKAKTTIVANTITTKINIYCLLLTSTTTTLTTTTTTTTSSVNLVISLWRHSGISYLDQDHIQIQIGLIHSQSDKQQPKKCNNKKWYCKEQTKAIEDIKVALAFIWLVWGIIATTAWKTD